MHMNKYCFSSKNGYQRSICEATSWPFHVRLQEFLIGGGGGGGAGVHTRLFPSPQRILQWFINGLFRVQLFLGGGRMGMGGLNANFNRNP